jgi:hypothetical protein
MKTEQIHSLTETFEGHAQQTESGVEYWLARDLQHLPGYAEWRNFNQSAVSKAKIACEVSGHAVSDHFVGVNKMIQLAKGAEREIDDHMLTRYACHLIARNGDPRKVCEPADSPCSLQRYQSRQGSGLPYHPKKPVHLRQSPNPLIHNSGERDIFLLAEANQNPSLLR